MPEAKPVTREEFEELKGNLFATWVTLGHLLAHAYGKEKATHIINAANDSASATEPLGLYHSIDEVLIYVAQAVENQPG